MTTAMKYDNDEEEQDDYNDNKNADDDDDDAGTPVAIQPWCIVQGAQPRNIGLLQLVAKEFL